MAWNRIFRNLDTPKKDALFLTFLFLASVAVAMQFDLFESVEEWIAARDAYQLDEFVIVSAIFSVFLLMYSLRRWFELRKILQSKKKDEEELTKINQQLSQKTKELEKHQQRSDKLGQLVSYLQVCKTRKEVYQFINESTEMLFRGSSGGLYVLRDSRNQLCIVAKWGVTGLPDFFTPDDCWGMRLGKRFLSHEDWNTPRCRHYGKDDNINFCIPLTAYGEIIGLFLIQFPHTYEMEDEKAFPALLSQSLTIFTEQISLTISNISLNEKLKDMAIHDTLTGLYNRQYLKETIDRELHRATRNGSHLALLMLDIDHFKTFNDTFGHSAGDTILKELSMFLKQFFRTEDFCCRYGGEEFLVLLTDTAIESLGERCEDLRQGINNLNVIHEGNTLGKVSASIGVAVFPQNGENFSQLIDAADKALYQAKEKGRNTVCFATAAPFTNN